MKFWHISKADGFGSHQAQAKFFAEACEKHGVEYHRILEGSFDALDYIDLKLTNNDILYRSARDAWAKTLEKMLINDECRHVYANVQLAKTGRDSSYNSMKEAGLPVISSIPFLPKKKKLAVAYAEYLGGFPLVVKVEGGMEGVGVIRVDSYEALNSLVDFLKKDESTKVRLMTYIPHSHYGRVVVVGDEVVVATRDTAPVGDFRTNAFGPRSEKVSQYEPDEQVKRMSIEAVRSIGTAVGGVDVLYGEDGNVYLPEVNMPFNFAETQEKTGVDIAHSIVKYLAS